MITLVSGVENEGAQPNYSPEGTRVPKAKVGATIPSVGLSGDEMIRRAEQSLIRAGDMFATRPLIPGMASPSKDLLDSVARSTHIARGRKLVTRQKVVLKQ